MTVNENALDTTVTPPDLAAGTVTGSLPGPAETDATNQLNGSGGTAPLTYALVSGGNAATAGTFGTIQVNADGSYVYTLTTPFDTSPDADNGANTEVAESFSYRVTDAAGNSATGTITVNIVDDVPTAHVGQRQCERRRAADGCGVRGAGERRPAPTAYGRRRGVGFVRPAATSTTDVTTGSGRRLPGLHGTLTSERGRLLHLQSTANNVRRTPPTCSSTRSRTATATVDDDADDQPADATVVAPSDNDVTVNENALDTTVTPPDLAAGTVTGSLPGSAAETDATNQLNGSGGTAPLTYALVSGGNAATAGTFGTIQVNAERQLRLHADHAVRHQPGRQQRHQHGGGGELHLQGDRRRRQQRDRHHHGQHRRRRADGDGHQQRG